MFRLLRYFSVASFVAIATVTSLLALFYKHTAHNNLVALEEDKNVALARSLLNSIRPHYTSLADTLFNKRVDPSRLEAQVAQFKALVEDQMKGLSIVKVKIYDLKGRTIYSTDPRQIGEDQSANPGFLGARSGVVASKLTQRGEVYSFEGIIMALDVLTSYIPMQENPGAPVEGVFELYSDVTSPIQTIHEMQKKIIVGVVSGLGFLYIVLFFIIRHADRILKRQEAQRRQDEAAIRESEARLSGILDMAAEGIISTDEKQRIILFNKGAQEIFGYSEHEVLGQPLGILLPQRFRDAHAHHVQDFTHSAETSRPMSSRPEVYGLRKNGEEFPAEVSISRLDLDGKRAYTAVMRDVTEQRQTEKTLKSQAVRDSLTGLYNRGYFDRRLVEEIARADREGKCLAVLLCDLDRFKNINDTCGHPTGDHILKVVSHKIRECSRGTDLVFRWGGDEFVVILSGAGQEGALIAAERIRKGILHIAQEGRNDLDVSIGISLFPQHGRSVEELVRVADRAMYLAKKWGSKNVVGEEEYRLDEQVVRTVFQPIFDIRLGQAVGYEALSRDVQGKLGILDLFEKYQAIGRLQELKEICFQNQLKAGLALGRTHKLFLNVDFAILSRLEIPPLSPGREVILEISEMEALHDVPGLLQVAKHWREAGYKFAIDDFGAGFVSLSFISQLVPEHIKLDRSTILQASDSSKFVRVLRNMLGGLRNCCTEGIIAEGVESVRELEAVKSLGIYLAQGFLLGKPDELKPAGPKPLTRPEAPEISGSPDPPA